MTTPPAEPAAAFATLVARFGEGWEKGNADVMAEVFAEDAVFLSGPFETPVRGRTAIRDYWRDVPREQAEIAFRYGEIFVVGPWFATEYKCTFRRRRTGEAVVVRGALFCETSGEQISEMRLYWERSVRRS
ncbi:MAG: nuclear transport factor 2 family protein [Gemmatimonadota bacterium]|nr:nuclear transport factor 2 family protein [Gemmatimonadota bacterium]MDH4349681.1 nuclear transport factor 2 family protein [Gemmatimonadota bacterium]MDH5196984.1 nuclear transport factor 2 family protein [Gemmatimonadota bacterium]